MKESWMLPMPLQIKERDIGLVLQAIVYAYNPLSMTAISALMQISVEETVAALSSLHSLIYIQKTLMYPSQYSMHHFMIS